MPDETGKSRRALARRATRIAAVLAAITVASVVNAGTSAETPGAAIIVAPNGSANGDGSMERPLDLGTALGAASPAKPGGAVLLRGGTYAGDFTSVIAGTPSAPITVRSFPGEWAVLDGVDARKPALTVRGDDTWFRDFEVTKSDLSRVSAQSGPKPTDIARGTTGDPYVFGDGVYTFGRRTKLINLVVHDTGIGIGVWRWSADDAEVYGNIVYNNGWLGADRGHGHGIYTQNTSGTKSIADNVVFNNFGYGLHAYDQANQMSGYDISGNVLFENGSAAGIALPNIFVGTSAASTDRITLTRNIAYYRQSARGDNIRLGFATDGTTRENGSITLDGNTIIGGGSNLVMHRWKNATVRNNEFVTAPTIAGGSNVAKLWAPSPQNPIAPVPPYAWDSNTYVDAFYTSASTYPVEFQLHDARTTWTAKRYSLPGWRTATRWDAASTYRRSADTRVVVQPNRYEAGRAVVTVLNRSSVSEISVQLSAAGLKPGQRFKVRDVQNLAGDPVFEGTYTGDPVTLRLTGSAVAQPLGNAPVALTHTPREFTVFLVTPA